MNNKKASIIEQIIAQKQNPNLKLRLKTTTENFTDLLYYTLLDIDTPVEENIDKLELIFEELVKLSCWETEEACSCIWKDYVGQLPDILSLLAKDAQAFMDCDPAANSIEEVYTAYPGFYAILIYRLSHPLYKLGLPLVPRLMTEYAHRKTGADINPGAVIGESFFIDHATSIVIGETVIIKDHVKMYQGVTLGGLYVNRALRNKKRHPTVENNVTIYANATILGGETVIGENSTVGGNTWITKSIPANSVISNISEIKIKQLK